MKRKNENEKDVIVSKKYKDNTQNHNQTTNKRQRDNNNNNLIRKRCRQEYYDYRSEKFIAYRFDIY